MNNLRGILQIRVYNYNCVTLCVIYASCDSNLMTKITGKTNNSHKRLLSLEFLHKC